jgi:predicted AAA+ superfamily ATPase
VSNFIPATQEPEVSAESDEDAMNRIATRFSILNKMSCACINSDIRALIVSGPPGVGKSFGVEQQLEMYSTFDRLANKKVRYEIVKGAMSALGLYATLYKFSDPKNVLVFDDCDIFHDEDALNILKAALDSGKRRKIFWNTDSRKLREEGIPPSFDFKGSVIFITNLNFSTARGKIAAHVEALQSRCHYLDLTINTERDRMLRIRQVHRDADGGLFKEYDFESNEGDQILDFMWENRSVLREVSLRMALKIADLIKVDETDWKTLAMNTCTTNR